MRFNLIVALCLTMRRNSVNFELSSCQRGGGTHRKRQRYSVRVISYADYTPTLMTRLMTSWFATPRSRPPREDYTSPSAAVSSCSPGSACLRYFHSVSKEPSLDLSADTSPMASPPRSPHTHSRSALVFLTGEGMPPAVKERERR